jgi:membrane-associated phospholipid phosphatase
LLAFPGQALLLRAVSLQLGVGACWVVLFHGADWLNGLHDWRVPVHFDLELSIPLLPAWTLVYSSLYLMFGLAPFILRERATIDALAFALLFETAAAALVFVLLPSQTAFAPVATAELGSWAMAFETADSMNGNTNCFPSLHVAFATSCAVAFGRRGAAPQFGLWASAIALSTLFTHQHHIVDVAGGMVLAAIGLRIAHVYSLQRPSLAILADPLTVALSNRARRRS